MHGKLNFVNCIELQEMASFFWYELIIREFKEEHFVEITTRNLG